MSSSLAMIDSLNLNEDSLFIDLGSGAGEEIELCVSKKIEVHSFEPNKTLFDKLYKKYANNPKVKLLNLAAWNVDGKARLFAKDSFKNNGGCTLYRSKANVNPSKFIYVNTIDIGKYINDLNRNVDVLKIDIEGAEFIILERLLTSDCIKKIKTIFCEDHRRKMGSKTWRRHREIILEKYEKLEIQINRW